MEVGAMTLVVPEETYNLEDIWKGFAVCFPHL
jgi:hypothetical protein